MPFDFNVGDTVRYGTMVGEVVHVYPKNLMAGVQFSTGLEVCSYKFLSIERGDSRELEAAREALQKTRERVSDLARENEELKKTVEWWQKMVHESAEKVNFMGSQMNKLRRERPATPEEVSHLRFKNNQLRQQKDKWKRLATKRLDWYKQCTEEKSAPKVYRSRSKVGNARWLTYNDVTYFHGNGIELPPGQASCLWQRAGSQEPETDPNLIPVHDERYSVWPHGHDEIAVRRIG